MKRSALAASLGIPLLFALGGCGANMNELLFQTATAAANTAIDLWLTELANNLADHFDDEPDDGPDLPDGDPVAGEQAYRANGCAACHGENAEGGIGPAMAGMNELEALQQRFGGGASHNGSTLSEQEIEDVAAWLLEIEPDDGGEEIPNGDAVAGAAAYADAGCAACHGADGEGGTAPTLAGENNLNELEDRFGGGASHFGATLGDEDIEDVATWLLGDTGGGDQSLGEQAYLDAGCDSCHGAAAGGGVGPPLAGNDELADLQSRFGGGASHFGATLSDEDIVAVADWLASL